MSKNPFSISFGRQPVEYITRGEQYDEIMETFTESPVTDQIYIITGIRGSGKTVLFSTITNALEKENGWVVVQLNTSEDMAAAFYSDLYYKLGEKDVKIEAEFRSPGITELPGGSVSVHSDAPERTIRSKIEELLKKADSHGRKVLAALDEVSNIERLKRFIKIFQEMTGKNLPLYFLGTAIYDNIDSLRNVPDMTFLYRAPRIILGPLDMIEIADKYQDIFGITYTEALGLSRLTLGYPFAFQALGYVYWNNRDRGSREDLLRAYDRLLDDRSYSKLWRELSDTDRKVCRAIAGANGEKVKVIRDDLEMDSRKFNVYRLRLKEKGLINTETYGKVSFTLPRFSEFVLTMSELYEL